MMSPLLLRANQLHRVIGQHRDEQVRLDPHIFVVVDRLEPQLRLQCVKHAFDVRQPPVRLDHTFH